MKQYHFLILIALIGSVSCKKDYTCNCILLGGILGSGGYDKFGESTKFIENVTFEEANQICKDEEFEDIEPLTGSIISSDCDLAN